MFDCAIIGAGLAGLVAAQDLAARGLRVVVLEARERVGGRAENVALPDGTYLEMGGQWIAPGFDALLELVQRYGLSTIDIPSETGSFVVRIRGEARELEATDGDSELNPFEVADLGQGLLRLRRLARRLADDQVWASANDTWLGQGLVRWTQTNLRTKNAQRRFQEVFRATFPTVDEATSLRTALELIGDGPDLESLVATNGRLQQLRIKGGVQELAQRMADDLGQAVRLGARVVKVVHDDSGATCVLADGEEIRARQVISTLPPRLAMGLEHEPPLPAWRAAEADKVNPGNVIKCYLLFETPFWRDRGLSGQSSADEGAVRVTFDTTIEGASQGHLMGFFNGTEAASLAERTPQVRERAFLEAVRKSFGDDVPKPVGYVERDWAAEEFTRGCHGAHFAPGIWTALGPTLAQQHGVLHWAGSEYSSRFNGYLEGAVRSGLAAAAAVASLRA